MAPKTNVYVDGFNLYFAIRKTPYKWLNPGALFDALLNGYDVQRIRYFTARIKHAPTAQPANPSISTCLPRTHG